MSSSDFAAKWNKSVLDYRKELIIEQARKNGELQTYKWRDKCGELVYTESYQSGGVTYINQYYDGALVELEAQQGGSSVIFISFGTTPKGFDMATYMSSLTSTLIANGSEKGTQVMEYSMTNRLKAWWNNSPTGTVAMTSRYGDMPSDAGGYAFLNNPNSIVIYWGLSGSSITGQGGTTANYVDATLHEIGHAFFGFDHDTMGNSTGISSTAPSVMDYRYTYQGIGFNAQEIQVVNGSIWSGR